MPWCAVRAKPSSACSGPGTAGTVKSQSLEREQLVPLCLPVGFTMGAPEGETNGFDVPPPSLLPSGLYAIRSEREKTNKTRKQILKNT